MTVMAMARRRLSRGAKADDDSVRPMSGRMQLLLQIICIGISITVLFPIVWIFSLALDPRNISRPGRLPRLVRFSLASAGGGGFTKMQMSARTADGVMTPKPVLPPEMPHGRKPPEENRARPQAARPN